MQKILARGAAALRIVVPRPRSGDRGVALKMTMNSRSTSFSYKERFSW
jgi:hypothetical protein